MSLQTGLAPVSVASPVTTPCGIPSTPKNLPFAHLADMGQDIGRADLFLRHPIMPRMPIVHDDRPMRPAMLRGLRLRCPNCGQGRILSGYLRLRLSCSVCGEDFSHQRTDDGPAYATVMIVGHLMAPALLWAFVRFRPDPVTLSIAFVTGAIALSLFLLPRMKGMFLAIQWSRRMHGFGTGDG
jgi:uncharacterized protein (DUF983 family)